MKWTVRMSDICGHAEEYEIPFLYNQVVYYAHPKRLWLQNSKWVVHTHVVTNMWAGSAGIYGVTLDGTKNIAMCYFNQLFKDREEAIEFCIKKNAHSKVKVYGG